MQKSGCAFDVQIDYQEIFLQTAENDRKEKQMIPCNPQ